MELQTDPGLANIIPAGLNLNAETESRFDTSTKQVQAGGVLMDMRTERVWRVLEIKMPTCTLFEITNKAKISFYVDLVLELHLALKKGDLVVLREEKRVFDLRSLSPKECEELAEKKKVIEDIEDALKGNWQALAKHGVLKSVIQDACKNSRLSFSTIKRTLVRYLESGCREIALLSVRSKAYDKPKRNNYNYTRRTGRPGDSRSIKGIPLGEKEYKILEECRAFWLRHPATTIKDVHDLMIGTYYMYTTDSNEVQVDPPDQCISYEQMYHYFRTRTPSEERDRKRLGDREYRNNLRNDHRSADYRVLHSGDMVEIDALEIDLSLVSSVRRNQAIGRGILYTMIDVKSGRIIACHVGFDNNAVIALHTLFLALAGGEGSTAMDSMTCITCEAGFLPQSVRCDRGADMMSAAFAEFLRDNNISIDICPPATGRYKPKVERFHREVHATQGVILDKNGRITTAYRSKHHKQATMSIYEYMEILKSAIKYHNDHINTHLKPTPDQIDSGIPMTPNVLWTYYLEGTTTRRITDREQYIYSLLMSTQGSVTRDGLIVNGLPYLPDGDFEMEQMIYEHRSGTKVEVKFDPRDSSYIYYMREDRVYHASLNMSIDRIGAYANMPIELVEYYKHEEYVDKINAGSINEALIIDKHLQDNNVLKEAKKKSLSSGANNTKDMRENRRMERNRVRHDNRASQLFGLSELSTDAVGSPDDQQSLSDLHQVYLTADEDI